MSRFLSQLRTELQLTLRNGEQLLLTLGIPVLLLVFFSLVDVLPTGTVEPVDFLAPGVLALAVEMERLVEPLQQRAAGDLRVGCEIPHECRRYAARPVAPPDRRPSAASEV